MSRELIWCVGLAIIVVTMGILIHGAYNNTWERRYYRRQQKAAGRHALREKIAETAIAAADATKGPDHA